MNVFTESLASSALTKLIRATGAWFSTSRAEDRASLSPCSGVGLADEKEVRVEEVADRAPERDELGAVAEPEVLRRIFCRSLPRARREPGPSVEPGMTVLVGTTRW